MSKRERWGRETAHPDSSEDAREAQVQALFAAAYRPLEPSDSFERRVGELVAKRDSERAGQCAWGSLPIGWASAAGVGIVILLVALGLTRFRVQPGGAIRIQAPLTAKALAPGRSMLPPRSDRQLRTNDAGRRIAIRDGALPRPPGNHDSLVSPSANPSAGRAIDVRRSPSIPAPRGRSSVVSRGGPNIDDLAYLNRAPVLGMPRWTPQEKWQTIEARLRASVPVKDDFVTIPFPRLVSTSDRQIAQAAESYKREAAIVDPRLSREVDCAFKATALSDLCDQLKAETGIQLTAGPSVADEKVTVLCEKMPLREVMRQLSRPFGYTWLRSKREGEGYRYELVQDLKSQLVEEELRNRDRNQAIVALDREMSQFRPYLGLTPEQARARARTAGPGEKELLEKLAGPGWAGIQMYFQLSPRDLAALRAGETLKFSSAPKAGEQSLPAEVASGIPQEPTRRRGPGAPGGAEPGGEAAGPNGPAGGPELDGEFVMKRKGGPSGAPPAEPPGQPHTEAHLSIEPNELGQFTLTGAAGRMSTTGDGQVQMWMSRDSLAVGQSPAVVKPENAATNAALKSDPALRKRVALAPAAGEGERAAASAGGGARTVRTAPHGAPRVTIADVLEKLHRATGMPIVSDFYTRLYRPEAMTVKDVPLFDTLNQLCDTMRMRWNKEAGGGSAGSRGEASTWLQFRSASFFHDRQKEVPNRLLSRWAASRKAHGALPLDDLIEIAQLSDAQLDAAGMAEGAREIWGLSEWELARSRITRGHLRFMASLNSQQRQAATSSEGLPFTKMTLAQQQQFITLIADPEGEPSESIEELAEAALRVDYTPEGGFEWRRPERDRIVLTVPGGGGPEGPGPGIIGPPTVREQTREAALAAARRIDPNATEAQIVPAKAALTIMYTTAGPQGRVPLMTLRVVGGGANVNRVRTGG